MRSTLYLFPVILVSLVISLSGCKDEAAADSETGTEAEGKKPVKDDFDSRTKREIQAKLNIPATEKFTWKAYKAIINSDQVEDVVITVNRLEFAMDEAIRDKKTAKGAELGYMGNHNYVMFYDGATEKFSVIIPVPSTPGRPLDISFANVVSPVTKDILVDYRIRNSGYRAYFTLVNEVNPVLVFRWDLFDGAGTDHPEAELHSSEESFDGRLAKDILIYESALDNNSQDIPDIYAFVPEITKKGKLLYHFIYEKSAAKYRLK